MSELLKLILSLSLGGTFLILILILCRPLVKDRLSKRWQYYIWLIAAARLLLPCSPETSLMGTLFQRIGTVSVQMDEGTDRGSRPEPGSQELPEAYFTDYGKTGAGPGDGLGPAKQPGENLFELAVQNTGAVCLLVWLTVSVGLLIRKITVYQSFVKYIKAGRAEVSDMARWERMGKLAEQTGVKGPIGLYTNSLISSPLLIGFFRPCIMLPVAELPDSDFDYTVLHELTHCKRRDMFYKWLVQLTICFHWFNPFVYLMGREVNRACELACDEAVIKPLDLQGRRAYGDTLLNAVKLGGSYKETAASVTLSESAELLKERLDSIMNDKQKPVLTAAVTFILSVVLICSFFLIGAYAADLRAAPGNQFQSMKSAITVLNSEQDITAIDVQASVGSLTVIYGDRPQIEIGAEVISHAYFSCENGTLLYRDDFESSDLSFDDIDGEPYKIIITIPHELEVKNLTVDVGVGSVDVQNIRTDNAKITGTGNMNLDGFHSGTLILNSTLADVSADDMSILKEFSLYSYGSTASVSGTFKGSVLIDSAGISSTSITFLNSDRKDYFIKSTWEPESRHEEPGKLLLDNGEGGILIDGERYHAEYSDSDLEVPYKLTVISRELMPMENIAIHFIK